MKIRTSGYVWEVTASWKRSKMSDGDDSERTTYTGLIVTQDPSGKGVPMEAVRKWIGSKDPTRLVQEYVFILESIDCLGGFSATLNGSKVREDDNQS